MKKISTLSALLVAATLTACGGGGGGSTTDSQTTQTPSSSGILTDSPVGGVQYQTSGGYSGTTDANGRYSYNPGDTVTFRIGAITLGTVTATGTVTPIELAGTGASSENKTTNLLILLQSLDADNNPSNGITINAATQAAAASAGSLDLTQTPSQFASTGNSALTSILTGAGLPRTKPVDPATALAHFKAEFYKQLKGVWTATLGQSTFILRFGDNGHYIHGEVGSAEHGGMPGTEVGQIEWEADDGEFSVVSGSLVYDGNGTWGASDEKGDTKMRIDGDKLLITDADGTVTELRRVLNESDSVVGTWALNSATTIRTQTFTFFPDGKYMMADPLGDTDAVAAGRTPCSSGGIEFGGFNFSVETGVFTVNHAPTYDTNSCAGLWNKPAGTGTSFTVKLNADGSSFTFDGQTFYRVSK